MDIFIIQKTSTTNFQRLNEKNTPKAQFKLILVEFHLFNFCLAFSLFQAKKKTKVGGNEQI